MLYLSITSTSHFFFSVLPVAMIDKKCIYVRGTYSRHNCTNSKQDDDIWLHILFILLGILAKFILMWYVTELNTLMAAAAVAAECGAFTKNFKRIGGGGPRSSKLWIKQGFFFIMYIREKSEPPRVCTLRRDCRASEQAPLHMAMCEQKIYSNGGKK